MAKPEGPSEALLRALGIIDRNAPVRPAFFARQMWPGAKGWDRSSRCGPNGSHSGGGMVLAAGGFLGKLYRRDLIAREYVDVWNNRKRRFDLYFKGYALTQKGKDVLAGAASC